MNTKDIKQLIEILEASTLESLAYKNENFEIELKKPAVYTPIIPNNQHSGGTYVEPVPVLEGEVKSPLVGVFYSKSTPDSDAFVRVGEHVEKGKVLCIIEAMKVMNEIKAPHSGVVKNILLKDGDTVGYDQVLFEIV